jgi:phosphomethylpyrimidine synthase
MDYAPGYDHISGAIGGALAAYFGADFLCYVTPAEHLRLPTLEDVREGVIASKIAAASADLARGVPSEIKRNRDMSRARFCFDWETQGRLCLDPKRFASFLEKDESGNKQDGMPACTMCGEWCAIKRQVP